MLWREPRGLPFLTACTIGLATSVASCGGGGDVGPPATPAAITIVSGTGQVGEAGAVLAEPLTVRVTSSSGSPVEASAVNFVVGQASGTVAAASATTNSDGVASTIWTVGTGVGTNLDTVFATVSGVTTPAVFTASVTAAEAASLESVSGNDQSGIPGQPLAQPLVVVAKDRYGNPRSQVDIAWSVISGGGSISPTISTSGTDGQAAAMWTPGNTGVNSVAASATGLAGSPVAFSAATSIGESRLTLISGDGQSGAPSQLLPLPLTVSVKRPSGTPVLGVSVVWAVASGAGSISQSSTPTDGLGQASTTWTLGPDLGPQTVTATVTGAAGSPLTFGATAETPSGVVTLTSISPTPLIEGQTATLTGTGFSTSLGDNEVKVDGTDVTVTVASANSLTILLPRSNCQPARTVAIQVKVGSESSNVLAQNLNPGAFTSVAVGQELVLQNPAEFCLQFASSSAPEDYLIGIQSTSEVVTSLTPVRLSAVVSNNASAVSPLPELASSSMVPRPMVGMQSAVSERRAKHFAAEAKLRSWERRHLPSAQFLGNHAPLAARLSRARIPADVNVGDVLTVQVPDISAGDACKTYKSIQAIVRIVGNKSIWLEDQDNPADGYSAADFERLSGLMDASIYDTDVSYFGDPGDLDQNGRIVVVISKEINELSGRGVSVLGFVFAGDFLEKRFCASSNEGEIFYGVAPDPNGVLALGEYPAQQARDDAPLIIAHEFTHIIQFAERSTFAAIWITEGQATLAQEVVGNAVEGKSVGQNYGYGPAANADDPSSIDWVGTYGFGDLIGYFGGKTRDEKVPNAPEQCSWLDTPPANDGPCIFRAVYGVPWIFLRWLSDQYGPTFPGGEQGLQRALIKSSAFGYENIARVIGVPIKTLLARWAAMLYVDDRISGLDPALTLTSWNLFDIFDRHLVPAAVLTPKSRSFSSFVDDLSVRAASSGYFRVSGASHPATAIRIRSGSDGDLPSIMQVFVVRLR